MQTAYNCNLHCCAAGGLQDAVQLVDGLQQQLRQLQQKQLELSLLATRLDKEEASLRHRLAQAQAAEEAANKQKVRSALS